MILMPDGLITRMQLGLWGESVVRAELRRKGFDVIKPRWHSGGDIIAMSLKIEVKTAYQNQDGQYRFCLCKDGCTDHSKSDIVILILVSRSGIGTTFVIPCSALENKKHLCLPKPYGYRGKYAEYKKSIMDGLKLQSRRILQ